MSDDILDALLRPLTECCGRIPTNHLNGKTYCHYCEMSADWCQCDTQDICDCCTHDWYYMDDPYADHMRCSHCGATQM